MHLSSRWLSGVLVVLSVSASEGQAPAVDSVTSSLESVDFHAVSSLEGVAPAKVFTTATISNHGRRPVVLEYGACALDVFAFTSPAKTGKPAWVSNPSGMCILPLYIRTVAPGQSMTLVVEVPRHGMGMDPIPAGHYFFTAELTLNKKKMVMDAGALTLPGTEDPLPASRSIDSIQFSSSVKRVVPGAGIPDSLEVMFIAHNMSHTTRQVRPEGKCVMVLGYKTRERRDSYYGRPAYENDWFLRPCQMPIISFDLAPGGVRVFVKRMPAPTESMYYAVVASFFDDAFPTREPYLVDVAADEIR
jgi:hypothetical protein